MTNKQECIIVDIDGTLALNDHRAHHLKKTPKDWDAFNAEMDRDEPNWPIIKIVKALSYNYPIIYCTGRMVRYAEVTSNWLDRYDLPSELLIMRYDNDFRDDAVIKREFLDQIRDRNFEPIVVLDDRAKVVSMWREVGLVCLQVSPGDF